MARVADTAFDVEVPIPAHLGHLGTHTLARLTGRADGPLIVALGGISANRFVATGEYRSIGWWPGLVGEGLAVDPARHRILGFDFAADESGQTAPSTFDQAEILAEAIALAGGGPAVAIGASYGAMVALALAARRPELVASLVVISAAHEPHSAATAQRELQRRIVGLGIAAGRDLEGLSIARGLAMTTYRTPEEFGARFAGGIPDEDPLGVSEIGAYLRARGDVYGEVMSPRRFLSLSASIDRHQVDPAEVRAPALLIGASTDRVVPPAQMQALAGLLPAAELHILDCLYGHDMFLKEAERVGALVGPFLERA